MSYLAWLLAGTLSRAALYGPGEAALPTSSFLPDALRLLSFYYFDRYLPGELYGVLTGPILPSGA